MTFASRAQANWGFNCSGLCMYYTFNSLLTLCIDSPKHINHRRALSAAPLLFRTSRPSWSHSEQVVATGTPVPLHKLEMTPALVISARTDNSFIARAHHVTAARSAATPKVGKRGRRQMSSCGGSIVRCGAVLCAPASPSAGVSSVGEHGAGRARVRKYCRMNSGPASPTTIRHRVRNWRWRRAVEARLTRTHAAEWMRIGRCRSIIKAHAHALFLLCTIAEYAAARAGAAIYRRERCGMRTGDC